MVFVVIGLFAAGCTQALAPPNTLARKPALVCRICLSAFAKFPKLDWVPACARL
jgi:hypothetical protein